MFLSVRWNDPDIFLKCYYDIHDSWSCIHYHITTPAPWKMIILAMDNNNNSILLFTKQMKLTRVVLISIQQEHSNGKVKRATQTLCSVTIDIRLAQQSHSYSVFPTSRAWRKCAPLNWLKTPSLFFYINAVLLSLVI